MRVKDSTGRECDVEYESDAYDFFELSGGIYDDGSEVSDDELAWIADAYASDIFQDIACVTRFPCSHHRLSFG